MLSSSTTQFFLLCTLTLIALSPRLQAAEADLASGAAGSVGWEVTCPFSILPAAGIVPITVTGSNGGGKATKASYKFESSPGYYGGQATTIASGTLDLPAGKSASATHWIWRGSTFESNYQSGFVMISISTPLGNSSDTLDSGRGAGARVAASQNIQKAEPSAFRDGGQEVTIFSADSLPADWRIFSGLSAVFITPDDWDKLSPGVRDALRVWLGLGGYVRVAAVKDVDAQRVIDELLPAETQLGVFAARHPVASIRFSQLKEQLTAMAASNSTAFVIGVPETGSQVGSRRRGRNNWDNDYNFRKQTFPQRDDFGRRDIPYFFICMLLIVFAVIVGPVSLHLWAGPGRRHRLFFTTPIFSLTTSGLLLLLMLFQDGMGIDGRRFVLLDLAPAESSQPNAIVYQEQFSRAGMTGGGGFELEEGLLPILPEEAWEESLSVRNREAGGSWFASRRDRSMALAGAVPVRWKVTHEGASEDSLKLRIESPITKFEAAWFVDGTGHVWQADRNGLDADGKLTFIPASNDPEGVMAPMFGRCSDELRKAILLRMSQKNQRNRFWALASDNEMASLAAQPTHKKIDWLETNLVITSKVAPK